jgi:hypothetical protein
MKFFCILIRGHLEKRKNRTYLFNVSVTYRSTFEAHRNDFEQNTLYDVEYNSRKELHLIKIVFNG